MKRSDHRILTTHCGSLARPSELLDLMRAKMLGEPYDQAAYDAAVRGAVAGCVQRQVSAGVDVVGDGEQGKRGFSTYITERLTGFEPRPSARNRWTAEIQDFPEYYQQYFSQAMTGGSIAPTVPVACTGPVAYQGLAAVQADIANLKAATAGLQTEDVFMPAAAPSGVGTNEYYPTDEAYLFAVAEALRTEYQAIVAAGFVLQVDDPMMTDEFSYGAATPAEKRERAELLVAAINHALQGIPPEKVRFHTCYGINEGPRVHDAALRDLLPTMLKVRAGAFSFEAANARHEHEYHAWEGVKLPEGVLLIPGVITHSSNIVEHPELIAERLCRYARIVGREQVIAGADCGFSSQATYRPEVHPTVVWAKFQAMAEGARLATAALWG